MVPIPQPTQVRQSRERVGIPSTSHPYLFSFFPFLFHLPELSRRSIPDLPRPSRLDSRSVPSPSPPRPISGSYSHSRSLLTAGVLFFYASMSTLEGKWDKAYERIEEVCRSMSPFAKCQILTLSSLPGLRPDSRSQLARLHPNADRQLFSRPASFTDGNSRCCQFVLEYVFE